MSEAGSVRSALLGRSWGYALFRKVLRADRGIGIVVRDHIHPPPGARVLDLGCGNGDLVDHLGEVEYVGVDRNVDYIRGARRGRRTGASATYVDADLADLASLDVGDFDVVVALGVLHHLDSALAMVVVAGAAARLRPGGRFVTLDPVFHPEQRTIARVLMAMDRGLYVRHPEDYDRLVAVSFPTRALHIRSDIAVFPYTHCIIEAQAPRDVEG